MSKQILVSIFFILIISKIFSQNISIHQEENAKYSNYNFSSEEEWDAFNNYKHGDYKHSNISQKSVLNKEVFGWNPYWLGTAYYDFDYSLLSEVSYFSYEVNYLDGNPIDLHYWKTTNLVDYAHNNNIKVSLSVTLFSNHQAFFANATAVQNLIDTLVQLVKYRNADGVNIDFEGVAVSQKANLTNFMINLSNTFHTEIPGSRVSIAIPAVDWSSTFDVAAMNNYVDLFLIMGYEYYWSGSSNAGPGSPKNGGDIWGSYNTTKSINDYLNVGVSPSKLCLAVPYYGREWSCASNSIPSAATSTGTSKSYSVVLNTLSSDNYVWDSHSSTPVYIYQSNGVWKQCWHNDAKSFSYKYDYVNLKNIAGIGIWALGYDGAYPQLWDMINEKFTNNGNTICEDFFTDTGGPRGIYYNNENWTYTIAPSSATSLKIMFTEFDLDTKDSLYIYNGNTTSSPLIGKYTGTNAPQGIITASSGAFTFKFKSDNATAREGWIAHWTCDNFSEIEESENSNVNIYPNPVSDQLNISFSSENNEDMQINIYNVLGQELYSQTENINLGTNIVTINLETLENGIYFVKTKMGNKIQNFKIIVNK